MARTDDAERFAAQLAEAPLFAESVYLGPKYHHTGGDKEVTDLLLLHHDRAILIEIKCQDDPASRAEGNLAAWIGKAGRKAVDQLRGSIRTLKERNYWTPLGNCQALGCPLRVAGLNRSRGRACAQGRARGDQQRSNGMGRAV